MQQEDFNYSGFDPETAFKLRVADAAKLQRTRIARAVEAATMFEAASKQRGSLDDEYSDARALRASGEQNFQIAPREQMESDLLAKVYGCSPRLPGASYFTTRTLVAAGSGSVSTSVQMPTGVPGASNSFLPLCDVQRPTARFGNATIGRWDSLPAASVQADEVTPITASAPTSTALTRAPVSVGYRARRN